MVVFFDYWSLFTYTEKVNIDVLHMQKSNLGIDMQSKKKLTFLGLNATKSVQQRKKSVKLFRLFSLVLTDLQRNNSATHDLNTNKKVFLHQFFTLSPKKTGS